MYFAIYLFGQNLLNGLFKPFYCIVSFLSFTTLIILHCTLSMYTFIVTQVFLFNTLVANLAKLLT